MSSRRSTGESSEGLSGSGKGVVTLTRENFIAWKQWIGIYALRFGSAGRALVTKEKPEFVDPKFDGITRMGKRIYAEDELGHKEYREDLQLMRKQRHEYEDKSQALVSTMLLSISEDIIQDCRSHADWETSFLTLDMMKLYEIIVFTVTAQGHTSIYVDLTKLLKLQQGSSHGKITFAVYVNSFRELVNNLTQKQKDAATLLKMIWNAIFVLGLDNDEYDTQLTEIYAKEEWPDYETLAKQLNQYTKTTREINDLRKDNPEGVVKANSALMRRRYEETHDKPREARKESTRDATTVGRQNAVNSKVDTK